VIRIVLAEDHELVREGLRTMLEMQDDMTVVADVGDGVEALAAIARHRPDIAVVDIQMPRLDGLAVLDKLAASREAGPPVLVLTTYEEDEYVFRALRAGAAGFLLKDVPRQQLLHAVRVVAEGAELLSPTITRRLVERFMRSPSSLGALQQLTEREVDVLRLVGQGLSNREIAAGLVLGEATVKTHLGNIFAKCGLRDRSQAVVLAYESGLVVPGS
jgi:DNA-binding NarL/FixJ family response regulator